MNLGQIIKEDALYIKKHGACHICPSVFLNFIFFLSRNEMFFCHNKRTIASTGGSPYILFILGAWYSRCSIGSSNFVYWTKPETSTWRTNLKNIFLHLSCNKEVFWIYWFQWLLGKGQGHTVTYSWWDTWMKYQSSGIPNTTLFVDLQP